MSAKTSLSKKELEARLHELELEYNLARAGLGMSQFATFAAAVVGIVVLLVSALTTKQLLSGTHIVIIAVAMLVALIITLSFVFGRATRIKAEISETKKLLEISAGEKVR